MNSEQVSLTDFLATLCVVPTVLFRFVLYREDSNWVVQSGLIDVVKAQSKSTWSTYDYGSVVFIQGNTSGKQISSWLQSLKGKIRDYRFRVPQLQQAIHWERFPSHTRYG